MQFRGTSFDENFLYIKKKVPTLQQRFDVYVVGQMPFHIIWRISFRGYLSRKRIDPKNVSYSNKQLNCISYPMVRKIFFAPNFPLFRKSGGEKKKKGNYEAFCFLSKRN